MVLNDEKQKARPRSACCEGIKQSGSRRAGLHTVEDLDEFIGSQISVKTPGTDRKVHLKRCLHYLRNTSQQPGRQDIDIQTCQGVQTVLGLWSRSFGTISKCCIQRKSVDPRLASLDPVSGGLAGGGGG